MSPHQRHSVAEVVRVWSIVGPRACRLGLILGRYEAKEEGFAPGGATLHSMMTPHGPDANCFDMWTEKELKPEKVAEGTQAFMFETSLGLAVTKWGEQTCQKLDKEYYKCWQDIGKKFTPGKK